MVFEKIIFKDFLYLFLENLKRVTTPVARFRLLHFLNGTVRFVNGMVHLVNVTVRFVNSAICLVNSTDRFLQNMLC